MPRQLDLVPGNLTVANNPNVQLAVTGNQVNNLLAEAGKELILTLQQIEQMVNEFLGYIDQVTGLDLLDFAKEIESLLGLSDDLMTGLLGNIPVIGPFLTSITGSSATGGGGLTGFTSLFGDVFGLLGNPSGLGTGSPTLPGIGSIPILGGLLSEGFTLLDSLIPGLDASKIISGVFSATPLQGLIDAISSGSGGGTGLNFTGLESLLASIPGVGPLLDSFVQTFLGLGGSGYGIPDLLRAIESIPVELLTGTMPAGMLSHANVGTLSNVLPQFLVNPNFDTANSIIGQGAWTWDGTQGPSGTTTSVFTTAAGVLRELFSNPIAVAAGQVLNISANTKWAGFTGPANSIALTAAKYDPSNALIGYDTLDSIASPGTSGGWTTLGSGSPYTVPSGVASIFVRPIVTAAATTGTVWFGKMSAQPTGTSLLAGLVPSLDASKIGTGQFAQSMVQDLEGILGLSQVGDAIQSFVDMVTGSSTNTPASGNSLGELGNSLATLFGLTQNNKTIAQTNSYTIAQAAVSKPSYQSIDPSADSVFNLSAINGTTPTFVNVTQAASVMGMIGTPHGGIKESVIWLGQNTTGITSIVLNLYSMNTTTGALTRLYSSPNIIGSVSGGLSWNYYNIPAVNYLNTKQGDWYAVEMQVVGTGTYQVAGMPNHWLPGNTAVYPQQMGATRNTSTTGLWRASGPGYSTTVNSSTVGASWAHPGIAGDIVVVHVVNTNSTTTGPGTYTRKATYGSTDGTTNTGTPMTSLGVSNTSGSEGWIETFATTAPVTGPATVAISITGGSTTFNIVAANSYSYTNVISFGTPVTNTTTSASLSSGAVTSAAGQIIVHAFVNINRTVQANLSAYTNATARTGPTTLSQGTNNLAYIFGDAPGAPTTTITASSSQNADWASLAIPIVQAPPPTTPTTISPVTYSPHVPWFGLSGSAGQSQMAADIQQFSTPGAFSYTIPTWCNKLDVIALGGGGGGQGCALVFGEGGHAGAWAITTLTRGGNIPTATTTITGTVGAGGAGHGGFGDVGDPGGATTLAATGWTGGLTAAGGAGGIGAVGADTSGKAPSPAIQTLNGYSYYAGGPQNGLMANGNAPGGGGSASTIIFVGAGSGAPGWVWIRAYQ